MPYKIDLNSEKGFIDIVYKGTVTTIDVKEVESKVIELVNKDKPTMFLTDLLNTETKFSITDLYGKPRDWDAKGFNRANKLAVVAQCGGKFWDDLLFFETTCLNQGRQVKLFSSRKDAIEWLSL